MTHHQYGISGLISQKSFPGETSSGVTECRLFCQPKCDQWSVVLKVDSAMHWINHYPLDCAIGFPNTYPIDSDLSDG